MSDFKVNVTEEGAEASASNYQSSLTGVLLGTASGIVAYAHERVSVVDEYVRNLSAQVLTLVAPTVNPTFPTLITAPALRAETAPTITAPVFNVPGIPLPFIDTLDTGNLDVQPFDVRPPTINYGTAPATFTGILPDAPGVSLAFAYPDLQVLLPSAPPLLTINTINYSGFVMPQLKATEPDTLLLVAPGIVNYNPGATYSSDLLSALKTHLQGIIAGGSSGLTLPGEKAIWDRGREREARSQAEALLKLEQMEVLGYAFPPGIWMDARLKIINEGAANDRGTSREVMAKSAELAIDYLKAAVQSALDIEGKLIQANQQVEQRLFESSRYATEAGVSIYNAKVQAYSATVEFYKVKVETYTAQIGAQTALVEVYKAQIEGEKLKVEINSELISEYKALIEAAMTNVEIYKAELGGIQIKADIEKTKVQLYGEFVQAFAARVNAYTAEIEAYKASLQAEQTKEQVYATQVSAYKTQVDAATALVENRVAIFKARIDAKQSQYEGYKAAVQGASAAVDAQVRSQGLLVDIYRANIAADESYNTVLTSQWDATLKQTDAIAQIGIASAQANGQLYISARGLAIEAAKSGAQISAQVAAAGINSVNYSGSVSSSESFGQSMSVSGSLNRGYSKTDATATQTIYSYSV